MAIRNLWLIAALAATSWAQPSRIVSTSPSITETLFALELGNRVVGVSTYCRYPPAVLALPKIGTFSKPDPEKIVLLRPDLVLIHNSATSLAERLGAMHIRYAAVTVTSLAEVYTMIAEIGKAAGVSDRAISLNNRIRTRLESLRNLGRNQAHPSVIVLVGRNPGLLTDLITAGPGTYLGELLEIAGGRNVITSRTIAYPRISLETVIRLNPDIILDASQMGESSEDNGKREQSLREPWLSHRELKATQDQTVFGLTSEIAVTPGPRVGDAVELIRGKIYSKLKP